MTTNSTKSQNTGGFDVLRRHYAEPLLAAKAASREGQGVVGLVGATAPVELVLAAGRFPVRISPRRDRSTPTADHYMDDVISPDIKSLFEDALAGEFAFLDLLVLSRGDDKLYYYLKELVRLGRASEVPTLHMFDLMGSQREAVRVYNRENLDWLISALERLAGREITDSAIYEAIALTDRSQRLQRRLMDLRWAGRVAGSDALQAIGAGYFMHPAAYADALAVYVDELETTPSDGRAPRLLVETSEPFSHLALHRRIEAAGAVVVAEDDQWGSRAAGEDAALAGSAKEAILRKYWLDTAHAGVYPPEAREAWFMAHLNREDVDGVIFYVPPSDRQFGWDYPRLAAEAKARGKPATLIRQDATCDDSVDAAIKAFVADLRPRG